MKVRRWLDVQPSRSVVPSFPKEGKLGQPLFAIDSVSKGRPPPLDPVRFHHLRSSIFSSISFAKSDQPHLSVADFFPFFV